MSFKHNSLFKFCIIATFLFCGNVVLADPIGSNTGGTTIGQANSSSQNNTYQNNTNQTAKAIAILAASPSTAYRGEGTTKTVCPRGQYVYKCGNYRVGFNWLKGAGFPELQTISSGPTNGYTTTKNYYVGDTTLELFEQMRNFFNGTNAVLFVNGDSVSSVSPVADRELILNYLCHPATSTITCALCPNNANVPATTVELDDDNKTIEGTWDFYTFADCYMDEFEDSTGSFYYTAESGSNAKAKCYYTNTDPNALNTLNGDEIGKFIPGLNDNVIYYLSTP